MKAQSVLKKTFNDLTGVAAKMNKQGIRAMKEGQMRIKQAEKSTGELGKTISMTRNKLG